MPYPTIAAGQILTAPMLQGVQWQLVNQGSDTTVNNTIVLVNTNLTFIAEANATYHYRLLVAYTSAAAAGARFAWSAPTGGAVDRWTWGLGNAGSGGLSDFTSVSMRRTNTTTENEIGSSGVSSSHSFHEDGIITGGNGGAVTFRFAQGVANATDASVTSSSRLLYLRIA